MPKKPISPPKPSDAARLRLPAAPHSIAKGSTLKTPLDWDAIDCLAGNLAVVHGGFDRVSFRRSALAGIEPLAICFNAGSTKANSFTRVSKVQSSP